MPLVEDISGNALIRLLNGKGRGGLEADVVEGEEIEDEPGRIILGFCWCVSRLLPGGTLGQGFWLRPRLGLACFWLVILFVSLSFGFGTDFNSGDSIKEIRP